MCIITRQILSCYLITIIVQYATVPCNLWLAFTTLDRPELYFLNQTYRLQNLTRIMRHGRHGGVSGIQFENGIFTHCDESAPKIDDVRSRPKKRGRGAGLAKSSTRASLKPVLETLQLGRNSLSLLCLERLKKRGFCRRRTGSNSFTQRESAVHSCSASRLYIYVARRTIQIYSFIHVYQGVAFLYNPLLQTHGCVHIPKICYHAKFQLIWSIFVVTVAQSSFELIDAKLTIIV